MTMTHSGLALDRHSHKSQQSESVEELLQNLAEILDDLETPQARMLLGLMKRLARSIHLTNDRSAGAQLSQRELQVLVLISHGYTRRDIAECLGISSHTAARHISNIYSKLQISSVAEATTYALQHNLIALVDKQ